MHKQLPKSRARRRSPVRKGKDAVKAEGGCGSLRPPRPCGFVSPQHIGRMLTHSWRDQRGTGAWPGDRPAAETASRSPTPSGTEWVWGEDGGHPDRGLDGRLGPWDRRAGPEGREGPLQEREGQVGRPAFSRGRCSRVVRAVGMFWRGTVLMVV